MTQTHNGQERWNKMYNILGNYKYCTLFLFFLNISYIQVLAEITQTWSVMSLSYETHTSTATPLLKADENLIETLEDNQVT